MIEALLFFLGGLSIGWLLLPQPFVDMKYKYRTGFMDGVDAALNAEKKKFCDGRDVLIIKGLFGRENEE
jgi:hypothetical protein